MRLRSAVDDWHVPLLRDAVIYELHVGSFTPEGTFEAVIPHLPYLRDLGVTTIEIMPIAQFPGARNWGYDGVFPYAAQHSYGGPNGLRRLVDASHAAGLTVILDVVYNHFGPEGSVFHRFGPYQTSHYRTPWGDAINFDGPHSDEVRAFFIDNALMWLEEYRIDGFRLDAVHEIYDPRAQPFLAELAAAVHSRAAHLGRTVHFVAESDLNDPKLILPRDIGGYALDAQWADDFCHALEAQLIGEESAYAADFGDFAHMAKAMRQAFVYTGEYATRRQRRFGRSPSPARRSQFIVFNQNHDQVGNRPGGERLGHRISPEQQKLAAAAVILSPFVPLLFMGEEYGETNPFLFVVDHGDPDLIEAVRKGRREAFGGFNWDDAAPDPAAPETLTRSILALERYRDDAHAPLFAWYRDLLRLRRELPVLRDPEAANTVTAWDHERVLLRHAGREGEEAAVMLAFGNARTRVSLPLPAGTWHVCLGSGGIRESRNSELLGDQLASDGAIDLVLPPHAVLLLFKGEPVQSI
ncbi:MAG: malto-oligosyltrehalose trehalohydrolase [Thermomicrobiales bacterium]